MKILIVKLSAIGDVIHTLPALTALRRHYPDAQIDWLVEHPAADLVRGHDALNRVLVWRRREFVGLWKEGRVLAAAGFFLRQLRELRLSRYDLVVDFQALLKSSLWVFLARGRRKAGFGPGMEHSENSHLFLNDRVPAVSMEVHALDRGLKLLQALGIPVSEVRYDLPIGAEHEQEAATLLVENGIGPDQRLIAINPVAKWPTKLWPPERFRELADRLMESGYQVAFTGSQEDRPFMDQITGSLRSRTVRLEGRTSLKVLAAVYRSAGLVISTDTGPMHLAAAVGTPVVALFGPTAPWRTGPYGEGHVVLRAGVSCSPCFSRSCKTEELEPMACMNRISVEHVLEAVARLEGAKRQEGG
mgnify:CR=1 FL=1